MPQRATAGRLTRVVFPRLADIIIASSVIIVTAPLMLLVAVLVKVSSRGPIFTRYSRSSIRYGLGGKPIRIWKFRTMIPEAHDRIPAVPFACVPIDKETRVTRVGRYLRKTGLDELGTDRVDW